MDSRLCVCACCFMHFQNVFRINNSDSDSAAATVLALVSVLVLVLVLLTYAAHKFRTTIKQLHVFYAIVKSFTISIAFIHLFFFIYIFQIFCLIFHFIFRLFYRAYNKKGNISSAYNLVIAVHGFSLYECVPLSLCVCVNFWHFCNFTC